MAYHRLTAVVSIPEHDFSEVLTVPDQTMSLKELMNRYALGEDILPYLGNRFNFYDDEDEDNIEPYEDPDYDISDAVNDINSISSTLSNTDAHGGEIDSTDSSDSTDSEDVVDSKVDV